VVRIAEQLADWRAAIGRAAALPGVDPSQLALWGFSLAGGHILQIAADSPHIAAAIAQTPLVDGRAAASKALRHTTPGAVLRLTGRAVADGIDALLGRAPLLVPTAGEPGTVAVLTTPDAMDGGPALDPDGAFADSWPQTVAARFALRIGFYRPIRHASQVRCPLLVLACDQDQSADPASAVRAAQLAPGAELVRLPGRHYAPFLEAHEQAVAAELAFLRAHLLLRPTSTASRGGQQA
jgi:pimeloyl-ACP methyl ester carboxylesterase